eukprot:CAMPEP_0171878544 /NCGR_PEP_ID=MMETSP0992-20121227/37361_1 /TAXON_ID=483369 /ORGANISM="non described non described, Strain CCMP2098" /LENGTH=51 /DNA_ID=CAMNT_0012504017 /DNA_START=64 /DNA_END=216 /DNA_ORIENTATION=+
MGAGQMAMTVVALSSIPASIMAWCCFTRTSKGTSSSFVHPPNGDSHRRGFL